MRIAQTAYFFEMICVIHAGKTLVQNAKIKQTLHFSVEDDDIETPLIVRSYDKENKVQRN
jgi:hypothetical protein